MKTDRAGVGRNSFRIPLRVGLWGACPLDAIASQTTGTAIYR